MGNSIKYPGIGPRRSLLPGLGILVFGAFLLALFVTAADTGRRQIKPAGDPTTSPADLGLLLEGAAAYCDRLSRSVLDFVCRERIEEWSYPDASLISRMPKWNFVYAGQRESHAYQYDYQLVRDRTGSIRESRILLREGKRDMHVPDASLKTRYFWHADIVMGPLGLLSRERQADHDYRIVREGQEGRERIVVIEAVPKPGVAAGHLVGTIWLRQKDAGILKIEWDPSSIDNYAGVKETAERFRMTPRIVLSSEYGIEKNGIRFPSRYVVDETYVRGGRHFQRSQTQVIYDQYRFFTVETEVIY
jgi:hypothetical protein